MWYYFGMVGSFLFIIIQLILLVDFAHSWNLSWLEKAEEGNRKCWFGGQHAFIPLNLKCKIWDLSSGLLKRNKCDNAICSILAASHV